MNEIITIFTCLHPLLSSKTYKQLLIVSLAMLSMTGRITMLSISRWTEKGGSYRTLQRFFESKINWLELNWSITKNFGLNFNSVILLAGDATTVTKAGNKTFGIGRFFSSIYSRPVPGIAFQTLSLINVNSRKSWPILMEQILPVTKTQKSKKKNKEETKGRGRPPGSVNKNNRDVVLNAEMTQVKSMLEKVIVIIGQKIKPVYFVYDGAFGNNTAIQMTTQVGMHLISKLRNNSALYLKFTGEYPGKGRPTMYGERIDYKNIPSEYLVFDKTDGSIRERIYQLEVLHKKIPDSINIAIVHKENLSTGKCAHVILFCSDLNLVWEKLVDYYRLRFQIEFNFRDAKQHWGLEDFMVVKKEKVINAANLSLFMVNLSQAVLRRSKNVSVLDLKARYCSLRYAKEAFKILAENAQAIKIEQALLMVPILGKIHVEQLPT
tara:strand:- start:298 stop:1605 length:1308 start_codon:yes stop_codon:yes gene_type:complete